MDSITALSVIINNQLTATDHISYVLTACSSLLYALRVLRSHGLPEPSVKDVFQATVLAKITYSLPAWFGFCTAADRNLLTGTLAHLYLNFHRLFMFYVLHVLHVLFSLSCKSRCACQLD